MYDNTIPSTRKLKQLIGHIRTQGLLWSNLLAPRTPEVTKTNDEQLRHQLQKTSRSTLPFTKLNKKLLTSVNDKIHKSLKSQICCLSQRSAVITTVFTLDKSFNLGFLICKIGGDNISSYVMRLLQGSNHTKHATLHLPCLEQMSYYS